MNKVLLGAALLLSVAATPAVAGPNWNQLTLSYHDVDASLDADSETLGGFGLSGSKLLNSNFFIAGGYSVVSESVSDDAFFDIDGNLNQLSLGLGARKAVSNSTDIFGLVSYEHAEIDVSSGFSSLSVADVDGYGLRAGVRSMVSPKFELSAVLSYLELDDESGSGLDVGVDYYFSNKFAVGVNYGTADSLGDDVDTVTLSGTMNF